MLELIRDINAWGKGELFRYGLIETLVIMLLFFVIAKIIRRLALHGIKKRVKVNTKVVMRLLNTTVYIILSYSCLSLLTPFDSVLSKLWGSAGILAVVIGFAAQESMGNFVNGILITTFKPFKIGDIVKVNNGEFEGIVKDISLRDTVIQTYENTRVIIPNSTMNKAVLENVSRNDNSKGNFLYLSISYESDLEKAIALLQEEIMKHPNFLDIRSEEEKQASVPPVVVRVLDFEASSIRLRATVYSKTNAEGFAMLSDLRIALKKRFDEEGIEFPYPHRTIQFKKEPAFQQEERAAANRR